MRAKLMVGLFWLAVANSVCLAEEAKKDPFAGLPEEYAKQTHPILKQFCLDCHATAKPEGELDLERFAKFDDVRRAAEVWVKVAEMLDNGEMPPKDAEPLSAEQRKQLRGWVERYLKAEAYANAGDPGPVVLRRLSNAEYTYVLRDITGVSSLQPASEFPVDGAAGEGFTNTGNALVMSPSLLAKYLDAGKDIADHVVLLPEGIRFSPKTTRRDWTEEILAEIRALYARHSDSQGGTQVNLQGIIFNTNGGGRLPVEKYFAATLAERDMLTSGKKTIADVARERGLSPKYLGLLWTALNSRESSLLLDSLRQRWRDAKPEDATSLAADVARWQQGLWGFSSVGHIGKLNGPKAWMEPVSPLAARQELRMKLPTSSDGKEVVLYLTTSDAGDGHEHDFAIWERPRLVAPGRSDLLLRDVRTVTRELTSRRERIFASAAKSLEAAAEASASSDPVDTAQLASKHGVETDILTAWLDYLGIGAGGPVKLGMPISRKITNSSGYDFVQGWVGDDALSVVANSSDQHVRIPGNMKPHGVAVHPAPAQQVAIGWRSPVAATLRIEGQVQHAHPECGNGVIWSLELRRGNTRQRLANGTAQGANKVKVGPLEKIAVRAGDVVSLVIGPRDNNHACDLTAVDLTLHDGTHEWSLAGDLSPDILAGNPHADRQGNAEVWHFYSEPVSGVTGHVIPAGSLVARWQSTASADEKRQLGADLQKLLQDGAASLPKDAPDAVLARQLASLNGPLFAAALQAVISKPAGESTAKASDVGLDPALFGKHPNGSPVEPASLCVRAPSVMEVRLPAELVEGAEFVASGTLHAETGQEGSVQLQVLTTKPESAIGLVPSVATQINVNGQWTADNRRLSHAAPILTTDGSDARRRIEAAVAEFRDLFPAALCYTKIVPVDEVVTLTLFYREDDALCRLILDDAETARLNRLWNELHFVSHDALTLVDAYEQLWQFATQDADPKVFEPLRKPIQDRAAAFRKQLVKAEPEQLEAVLEFASLAYRRPLRASEANDLRKLYRVLRDEELGHDEALRLTLARVLVSPAFLYRAEKSRPPAVADASRVRTDARRIGHPVADHELATRLSFFLWSTSPDAELREAAANNLLHENEVLIAQTRRMLKDARVRRLATEFACQWLHIYDFDSHDEKSPAAFPTFSGLRGAMYEESIHFFTDLFQRDGSVLELLDADHTFVNEELAKHYGIDNVTGPEWRRVDGVKQHGRGGILAMATTLSKQSGASRTSPILRGNWISEVLLGDKLPKPPKGVPQLPDVVPAGLTERQLIEKHSSVAACAKCHAKIDPLGFALEGFDAIGRTRRAEPSIDVHAKLLDGTELDGLNGLRSYLLATRRNDFVRQFCRKLLGYSLGRAVQLSDEPLLEEIQSRLKANGYRINIAMEEIVQSPQFRMVRGRTEDENASRKNVDPN